MKKIAHVLTSPKRATQPKFVIFFDTETYVHNTTDSAKELRLKLGYAVLTRRTRKGVFKVQDSVLFTRAPDFYSWVSRIVRNRERYWMVAHNISFDVRVLALFDALRTLGFEHKGLINDNLHFIARFRRENASILLINNQQIFNSSLQILGESIGFSKGVIDFDSCSLDDLAEYCKRDVEVMVAAWNKLSQFIEENDLGSFAMSAASLSFNAFRHRFMPAQIYIHNSPAATKLERESYHGGRTECFFIGHYDKSRVYYLDVNSMYPFIMQANLMPVRLAGYRNNISLRQFDSLRDKFQYIVEATVRITKPVVPIIQDNRLVFPIGVVRGVFPRPELDYALTVGTLERVERIAIYESADVFHDFVDFFYAARQRYKQEGNDAFQMLSKLMMNSLYGKFGQKNNVWEHIGDDPFKPDGSFDNFNADTMMWERLRAINGRIEKVTGFEEGYNSLVAIASFVTSYARVQLARYIDAAGWGNVLYTDTDSLFVSEEGYRRLASYIDPSKLGALKLEKYADGIWIRGNKDYTFDGADVIKGIRKDAQRLSLGVYEQDRFEGFNGALRRGNINVMRLYRQKKELSRIYHKGIVTASGFVQPFVLQ